jgi:3-oxoacyl-[acyl-carrier protein] reductase
MSKTAIITGSGRGIGAAIAKRLAKDGFDIIINEVSQEALDTYGAETVEACRALGVRAESYAADVSDYAQCEAMVKWAKETFGTIDVLVNNAGITRDGLLLRMSEETYDTVIRINQKSVFNMTKLVGAVMLRQKSGKIVNLASVAGLYGNPGQMNYSASKGAIIAMTKTAAKELGSRGINVNAVAPGFIQTPMTDKLTDEQKAAMLGQIAMKRYGQPEEIAGVVSFLCSEDSSYVTGQTIEISGGLSM